ncbi:MAG: hypothetical protein LiPW30_188 [Parcubacteria group bacterium LiPW_30]|nr:MAG: hypothetical protein LiPW30_188 [Parcubacteria group bacterium LiPW_30]
MNLNNLGSLFDKIKKTILEKEAILDVIIEVVKKETGVVLDKKSIKINKKTVTISCNSKEKSIIYIKKEGILKLIKDEITSDLIKEIN